MVFLDLIMYEAENWYVEISYASNLKPFVVWYCMQVNLQNYMKLINFLNFSKLVSVTVSGG